MVKKKKKYLIRRKINHKGSVKRRQNRKLLFHEPRVGLPFPPEFGRVKSKHFISNKPQGQLSHNQKKNFYIKKHLPPNLDYLIKTQNSPLFLEKIKKGKYSSNGVIKIPEVFSIIEKPKESYDTFKRVISALLVENNLKFTLDYAECEKVELGSQILLDIILKDFMKFVNKCQKIDRTRTNYFPVSVGGININNDDVQKIIFSVGSPVILKVKEQRFPDIVPYKLCIHDNEKEQDLDRRMERKELDTTEMADYVIDSLKRINKVLSPEKLDDLCTVIGEILINAEEHSTTKYRYSIGYFKEKNIKGKHYGIFRLVVLNFGQTIYEKFSAVDCPNKEIVIKMKNLSEAYTKQQFFRSREFEEENLWTLYALQDGVSSTSPTEYKRGNGSIRFIDSFFNLKGTEEVDNISNMTILSGKTRIVFDGKYSIVSKTNSKNENFKVMTFNESGNIEDKPDSKYVSQAEDYFPGTMISAKILINDDDII